MQTEKIALDETDCFSSFFIDYISGKENLKPFYGSFPSISNFKEISEKRNFHSASRKMLSSVLNKQYEGLSISEATKTNLQSLSSETTFTITTGHQLNIFTGPLYFIYKIVTAINAARELKEKYPSYDFVPVYWMASEDHDFEEINHFHLHGKKYNWLSDQKGAVGRFDPTELQHILNLLPGDISVFKKAYLENSSLAAACRQYVNDLFGKYGIVVIDADDAQLKTLFKPVITNDLFDHSPKDLVGKQTNALENLGYKTQVHAREINFFYLVDGLRSRLEKVGDRYTVVDTELSFSAEEIHALIDSNPERFSPNVILRPLYQEMILPNLAYIGGPSELVYWLQLKPVFDHFNVAFPALMPRNFGAILTKQAQVLKTKTGITSASIFKPLHILEKEWTAANSDHDLSFSKNGEAIKKEYDQLKMLAGAVDPTLIAHIEALGTKALKRIEQAEKKMIRAEKRHHQDALGQIEKLRETIFPRGTLQERKDNFLNFYLDNPLFIDELIEAFDPFDYRMHVMSI